MKNIIISIIVFIGLVIGIFIIGTGVLTYVLRNEGGQIEVVK